MDKPEAILRETLPPDEIAEFKALAYPMQVKAGYVLYSEGDYSNYIYFIETGHVKLYKSTSLGEIITLSIRKPGDVIGIAGVLTGRYRCVFAETIDICKIWRMKGESFIELLYARPRFAVRVAALLGKRLCDAEIAIANLTSMEVDRRLAWLLKDLAATASNPDGEKLRIAVKLTHQDIASMIGTCRQTVTTALGRLKEDGIINVGKRYIEIIDLNKLSNM
ncbi:MAG TPA: Crp/Fnr family transcriptional regulator [Methylomusa anaerophila]|uniref:Global nitrogen regulator n=1 Tax=Methylomusa anaerophila TaxID=1930071 RepID=A0A348AEY1_9FIRM|nr:Crp/Fnr family transcriptional regulator [Methylomusa anaerophila]BBB89629.1 global nitrogen regulator [Methylomusa anaerophila]HML89595.1 Crp/Fnr family transcriptional regulator [Methylomusa anaerophila]